MEVIEIERIPSLSNEELFHLLKEYNLTVGPITGTTRSLYEKKLKLHLNTMSKSVGRSAKLQQQQKENDDRAYRVAAAAAAESKKYVVDEQVEVQQRQQAKFSSRQTAAPVVVENQRPLVDRNVVLGNISNSNVVEQQQQQQQRQRNYSANEAPTARDDTNVRFIRSSEIQSQSFSSSSSSSSVRYPSTPQTADKFANRLNSYGLLKPDTVTTAAVNNSINILKRDKSPVRRSLPEAAINRMTRQRSPVRQQQQQHKSPDNIKIFASSIIRDNSPVKYRIASAEPKRISPRSRKSPENHKIFANSIIRDNSPDDVTTPVQQEQKQAKPYDLTLNWKYLAAVGFMTIIAYFTMINIQNIFLNDEF
jgi:hypothetical protein